MMCEHMPKHFKSHFRRKAQAGPHLSSFCLTPFSFHMVCRLCKVKVSWGPRGKLCPCPLRIGKLRHSNRGRTCSSIRKRWPFPPIRSGTSGGPSKLDGKVLPGRTSGSSGGHNQMNMNIDDDGAAALDISGHTIVQIEEVD